MTSLKPDEAAKLFIEMPNEEIRKMVASLNPEQLKVAIESMNEKNTPHWKGKTRAIISGISNQSQLELVGCFLSVPQFLDYLEGYILSRQDSFNKLLAILVGMTNRTFGQLLSDISDEQLQILLQTSCSEPLQHHLSVFTHDMHNRYLILSHVLDRFFKEIENISLENVGRLELITLKNEINYVALEFNKSLEKMKNGLRVAWSTHRADLVENLNIIKDKYLHTLTHFIGHPETSNGATGLYELLYERLKPVFGNPYDIKDAESLKDDERSIDALVKFSIWYLKDYWKIGLLPQIKTEEELELDPSKFSENERAAHREELFAEVQNNLEKLHLKTLRDLKKEHIYSKAALLEYIHEKDPSFSAELTSKICISAEPKFWD